MKYLFVVLVIFSNLFAQNKIDIKNHYKDILYLGFDVLPNKHIGSYLMINKLPEESVFADLINNNLLLFDYMFQHNNVRKEISIKSLEDTTTCRLNYFNSLKNSIEFDSVIIPIVNKYLQNKNLISNYSDTNEEIFSKDDILKIAVRFFYPSAIFDNKIQAHVCVGINGMDDFPHKRNLVLEGFIFQVVFNNLDNSQYQIREDFENAKNTAIKLELSNDKETILKRSQGIVWTLMYHSKGLWEAIIDSYKIKKNILPFKIKIGA